MQRALVYLAPKRCSRTVTFSMTSFVEMTASDHAAVNLVLFILEPEPEWVASPCGSGCCGSGSGSSQSATANVTDGRLPPPLGPASASTSRSSFSGGAGGHALAPARGFRWPVGGGAGTIAGFASITLDPGGDGASGWVSSADMPPALVALLVLLRDRWLGAHRVGRLPVPRAPRAAATSVPALCRTDVGLTNLMGKQFLLTHGWHVICGRNTSTRSWPWHFRRNRAGDHDSRI